MSSEAIAVRDKLLAKLKTVTFFSTGSGFHYSTNKSEQIQPQSVPFLGVYFIDETTTPDGDPNMGEVRFRSVATIGVSVIVQNNDADAAEHKLDAAWLAFAGLFADPTLYNWKNAGKPGEVAIQAYTRGSRTHVFGDTGASNEVPIAELRFNLTVDLGTITYPPVVTDDFETLHIKTQFPGGDTQADIDNRQQVEAEYSIPIE